MGQCASKQTDGTFNQTKKSERQLRTGLKFKDREFGGFIGFSTTIHDVYSQSGVGDGPKDVQIQPMETVTTED